MNNFGLRFSLILFPLCYLPPLPQVDVYTITAQEMREIRIKAAKHIFVQMQAGGQVSIDAVFSVEDVNMTNIVDGEVFYGGFTFVSSVAELYATQGHKTAYADAAHMEGKGHNTHGTYYEIGTYNANNSLLPLVSGHGIAPEGGDEWRIRFKVAATIPGFDVPGRVTIVDLEKGLDTAHDKEMSHGTKFNDERHVLKNMLPRLGPAEKATGPALYSRALRAPSTIDVDLLKAAYGLLTKKYLDKFPDQESYRAYSLGLKDTIVTSQGAESAMNAALSNKIRRVEPTAMLKLIAETQCRKFNAQKVLRSVPSELGVVTLGAPFASCMYKRLSSRDFLTCRLVLFRP